MAALAGLADGARLHWNSDSSRSLDSTLLCGRLQIGDENVQCVHRQSDVMEIHRLVLLFIVLRAALPSPLRDLDIHVSLIVRVCFSGCFRL